MNTNPNYKWYILILTSLTCAFTIGAPAMSLAVLFSEISGDLDLNLVQMGLLWSIGSLPAIFTSPLSGAINDRFGPKRVILAGIFLVALAAGLRGLATSFMSMLVIIILIGILLPLVTMSSYKVIGIWFPRQQLGLANGILSMGLALGFLIGSMLSATVFSPSLGGWRNVMFFYGALAMLFCIPWYFAHPAPETFRLNPEQRQSQTIGMGQALTHIVKLKNVWLIGITVMGVSSCLQGLSGYLSLYLRGMGWTAPYADGALSLLSAMSMIFILPIMLWSDRLGSRKKIVLGMLLMVAVGTGLLSFANGLLAWGAIILIGMVRDSSTALLMTMTIETDGVGADYAGSASGFVMFFMFVGGFLSPPIGNKLADFFPGLPFIFWAGLAVMGIVSLSFVKPSQSLQLPGAVPTTTLRD